MSRDDMRRYFLILIAVCIAPIALSYGMNPEVSLPWLLGIDASDPNLRNIFRAVMGLYLALVALWIAGALRSDLRLPALYSLFAFVTGIALGRIVSVVVDGWPHPLLLFYLVSEIGLALISGWLIFGPPTKSARA
ncbi:MAG: DUF4345 domain-containing protein [Pseudomonadota bacterium]